MSLNRCNDVVARYDARAAWTAASRDLVGLYLATDSGVVFARVPAKVWAESINVSHDSNRHPLPTAVKKLHVDELPETVRSGQRPAKSQGIQPDPKSDAAHPDKRFEALQAQYSRLERSVSTVKKSAYDQELEMGRLHGRIGLLAALAGISDNAPTEECFKAIENALRFPRRNTEDSAWLRETDRLTQKFDALQTRHDALQKEMVPLHKRATGAEAQVKLLQAEIRRLSATATQPTQP